MNQTGDDSHSRAFLTVIAWPDGFSRAQCAELVSQAAGLDQPTALLKTGMTAPLIFGELDIESARAAVETVIARGGEAFAPTMSDIESLGATLKIRNLTRDGTDFLAEMWRDQPQTIHGRDIQVVIRARLSQVDRPRAEQGRDPSRFVPISFAERLTPAASFGAYGALGLAIAVYADYDIPSMIAAAPATHTSHKIDLHTADGRVFQIDADKFAFEVLGDYRGSSDLVNTDRLCELFAILAPEAVVDPYFKLFKPPPEHRRMRLPMMRLNDDDPAFAFYSRWAALMYRHLRGQDGSGAA